MPYRSTPQNHPWMTLNNTQPMASTEQNVEEIGKPVTEVTDEDLRTAIKPLGLAAAATVLRAAAKWKKLGSRGSFSSIGASGGGTSPTNDVKASQESLLEGLGKLSTTVEDGNRFKDAEGEA